MKFFWQLQYPDGRQATEPPEEVSIRAVPKGAARLVIVDEQERPVTRVELKEGVGAGVLLSERGRVIPSEWVPIFYRKRSLTLRGRAGITGNLHEQADEETVTALREHNPSRLDAIIFGRARDMGTTIDAELYLIDGAGQIRNVPRELFDQEMVQLQVMGD